MPLELHLTFLRGYHTMSHLCFPSEVNSVYSGIISNPDPFPDFQGLCLDWLCISLGASKTTSSPNAIWSSSACLHVHHTIHILSLHSASTMDACRLRSSPLPSALFRSTRWPRRYPSTQCRRGRVSGRMINAQDPYP